MALLFYIILSFRLCNSLLTTISWSKSGVTPDSCPGAVCCGHHDIIRCFIGNRGQVNIERTIKQKKVWVVYSSNSAKTPFESSFNATPLSNVSKKGSTSPTTPVQLDSVKDYTSSHVSKDTASIKDNSRKLATARYSTITDKSEDHTRSGNAPTVSGSDGSTNTNRERNRITKYSSSNDLTQDVPPRKNYDTGGRLSSHENAGNQISQKHGRESANYFKITSVYAIYLRRNKPIIARIDRQNKVFKTIRITPRLNVHRFLVTIFVTDPVTMTVYQAFDKGISRFRLGSFKVETLISDKSRFLCVCYDHSLKSLFYITASEVGSYLLVSFDVKMKRKRLLHAFTKGLQFRGFDTLTQELYIGYKGGNNLTFMSYVYPKTGHKETYLAPNLYDEYADCSYSPERKVMVYCSSLKKNVLSFHVKTGVVSPLFKSPYEDGSCAKMYVGGDYIHSITDKRLEEYNFQGEKLLSMKLPKHAVGIRLIYF